jgi:hypothetical protein
MKLSRLALASAVAVLSAIPSVPASAQQKPGNVTLVTEMKPKPGAEKQFEAGLKQLAAWYASNNDPQGRAVFQQITGENAGKYFSARRWMHWADLDKPVLSDEQSQAEFEKAMGGSVATYALRVYEEIPALDHPARSSRPLKYYDIETFHVPLAKQGQFAAAMARFREAVEKTKTPVDVSFLALDEGGQFGTWLVVFGHNSWADFGGPTPDQILVNAFGKEEGTAIVNQVSDLVGGSFTMDVVEFRPELSYFPKK